MPINEGNKILPGEICESCIHLRPMDGIPPCPNGNNLYPDHKSLFVGEDRTPGSLCGYYKTFEDIGIEAETSSMKREASSFIKESQLNMALYRKIRAMSDKDQKKFFKYWDYLFPSEYAEEMTTDKVETKQREKRKPHKKNEIKKEKDKDKSKFEDTFKTKKEK